MCCLLFLTDMARGRGRGSTLPGRTSSGRGNKASSMLDPVRGSGVDETPQQTEEVVNVSISISRLIHIMVLRL